MLFRLPLLAAIVVCAGTAVEALAQEKQADPRQKDALAVVKKFMAAAVRGDAEQVLQVAEPPFVLSFSLKNFQVFEDEKAAKKLFSKRFTQFGTPEAPRIPKVAFAMTIRQLRNRFQKRIPEKLHAVLENSFAADDLALFVQLVDSQGRDQGGWVALIRFREGKPVVGGLLD